MYIHHNSPFHHLTGINRTHNIELSGKAFPPESKRSWVRIPLEPKSFSGLLFNCTSLDTNCKDPSKDPLKISCCTVEAED